MMTKKKTYDENITLMVKMFYDIFKDENGNSSMKKIKEKKSKKKGKK